VIGNQQHACELKALGQRPDAMNGSSSENHTCAWFKIERNHLK